ncbi:MAG: hypothetical protein ACPGWR_27280 [Ardenticatenaceae bacterium]
MLDGDRLLLRASLDQQEWFDEVNLVWKFESSDVYFADMNYRPNNGGFGKDYYWTVTVIAADGTEYSSPPAHKFRWDDPNSGNGGGNEQKDSYIPPSE